MPEKHAYEIKIEGHLDSHWDDWFEDFQLSYDQEDNTMLTGTLTDQAALHGLLVKIRDLGLTLLSVARLDTR